ncbi:MAG TPA: SpoIIE family protein phosphatase [Desulfuromonadales bacterium]|nr:SpoIIE family protein phosphatase [Desulfuromonadales bacterium]
MSRHLRILHLEDDPADAELVQATLAAEALGCHVRVVATREDFVAALEEGGFDVVLADFALPGFDGMTALAIVREQHPDLPFVFVSGRLGEESAIESLRNGATDYVLKNKLSRLVPAVSRALSEASERAELRKAEAELARATSEIRERAESYQNLFNSIRDVIFVTDHNRIVQHVNQPALREVFGYELEEVEGKSARFHYADEEGFLLAGREIYDHREPVPGKILELGFRRKNGELFTGELYAMKSCDCRGVPTGNIGMVRDISERKRAEEALRESEMRRYLMLVELVYAAEVQAKLLPRSYPHIPDFDIAARCLPAKQVGGDFFDWQEVCTGVWAFTLGDVMGKGMAAAMLMATVRAAMRSTGHNRPSEALRLTESAVLPDLENAESFVTLFLGQLFAAEHRLTFVDCGHGYVFLRRSDGAVEELVPRGLPLGVPAPKVYQEGTIHFAKGDTLVIYSDGLVDARPELALDSSSLARYLDDAASAQEMVDRLMGMTEQKGPLPDDVTVLVVRCTG